MRVSDPAIDEDAAALPVDAADYADTPGPSCCAAAVDAVDV